MSLVLLKSSSHEEVIAKLNHLRQLKHYHFLKHVHKSPCTLDQYPWKDKFQSLVWSICHPWFWLWPPKGSSHEWSLWLALVRNPLCIHCKNLHITLMIIYHLLLTFMEIICYGWKIVTIRKVCGHENMVTDGYSVDIWYGADKSVLVKK